MSKQWILVGSVLLLISLIGCGKSPDSSATAGYIPGQVEEAYAYTHGGYVGQATVKVLDDGKLDVALDEAFLPHTLAIVDLGADEWNKDNTAYYSSRGNEVRVAKYVEYAGKVYVGVTAGGSLTYVEADETGKAVGGTDLEKVILRNQGSMKAYYGIIRAGGFKLIAKLGAAAVPVTTTSYGGLTKTNSPEYWNTGRTWAGNMKATEEFIEANGTAFSLDEMKQADKEDAEGLKKWSVADAVTAATNSDFKDYFGLAQMAVGRLKMK